MPEVRYNSMLQRNEYVHQQSDGSLLRHSASQNLWIAARHDIYEPARHGVAGPEPASALQQPAGSPRRNRSIAPAPPPSMNQPSVDTRIGIYPFKASVESGMLPYPSIDLPNLRTGGRSLCYDIMTMGIGEMRKIDENLLDKLIEMVVEKTSSGNSVGAKADALQQQEVVYSNIAMVLIPNLPNRLHLIVATDSRGQLAGVATITLDEEVAKIEQLASNPGSLTHVPGAPSNAGFALYDAIVTMADKLGYNIVEADVVTGAVNSYRRYGFLPVGDGSLLRYTIAQNRE